MTDLERENNSGRTPPLILTLFLMTFVVASVCLNFSWIHQFHNSDSVVLPLLSLERPVPYYWAENRYGMLVPLLFSAVRDPVTNLLGQTQVLVAAVFGCIAVFCCFYCTPKPGFTSENLSAGSLTFLIGTVVFRPTDRVIREFFLQGAFFLSLVLSLLAVALLLRLHKRPVLRFSAAAVILLVCFWVAWPIGPVPLLLALLLPSSTAGLGAHLRQRLPALLLITVCLACMYLVSLQFPRLVSIGFAKPDIWLETASRVIANARTQMLYSDRALGLMAAAILLFSMRLHSDSTSRFRVWTDTNVILVIAIGFGLSILTTEWVVQNNFEWRYWTVPAALLFMVAASHVSREAWKLLRRVTGSADRAALACAATLLAVVILIFPPSLHAARTGLEKSTGAFAADIIELKCTHVIGNYWMTWTSVYNNRFRGAEPKLWGVALRADPTQEQWSKVPLAERRYCGLCGDWEVDAYRIFFKLPPLKQGRSAGKLCLYTHE